jgi:cold-inducible RNA-binding protein
MNYTLLITAQFNFSIHFLTYSNHRIPVCLTRRQTLLYDQEVACALGLTYWAEVVLAWFIHKSKVDADDFSLNRLGLESSDLEMSSKLFVGGLAWATTESSLTDHFSAFGDVVEAKVITDRDTGRSRGFGFVTYGDAESAKKAVEGLNGSELDGRPIRVDLATERTGGGGGGGGNRGGGGGGGGGGGYRGGNDGGGGGGNRW